MCTVNSAHCGFLWIPVDCVHPVAVLWFLWDYRAGECTLFFAVRLKATRVKFTSMLFVRLVGASYQMNRLLSYRRD